MRCEHCIALIDDGGYERDATEWWCAVGEEEVEFADGTIGCKRRSIDKLKRDMETQIKIEEEAFVKECDDFWEFATGVDKIQSRYNIDFEHAACYICNFEDDFICYKHNDGCKNIELCKSIKEKELLKV